MSGTDGDAVFNQVERLVKTGDLAAFRQWLASGPEVDLRNRFGWTPLMLAALHGRTDFVELLLSVGADPDLTNDLGDTARSLAQQKGSSRTARALGGAPVLAGQLKEIYSIRLQSIDEGAIRPPTSLVSATRELVAALEQLDDDEPVRVDVDLDAGDATFAVASTGALLAVLPLRPHGV